MGGTRFRQRVAGRLLLTEPGVRRVSQNRSFPRHGWVNESTGATEITERSPLRWSLPVLMGLGALLFAIGRALPKPEPGAPRWEKLDYVRLLLPAFAFFAWAGLTGTSALTPWVESWSKGWTVLLTGVVGVVVLAVAAAISDSD